MLLGISGPRKGKVFYWAKDFEPIEDLPVPASGTFQKDDSQVEEKYLR